jgi:hypothetical protein
MLFKSKLRAERTGHLLDALGQTKDALAVTFGTAFSLSLMDNKACEFWATAWVPIRHPEADWDWAAIHEQTRGRADQFCVALWHDDTTLCGLALVTVAKNAVRTEVLEGNPDSNHPLKRCVLPILLDAITRFGQLLGRGQITLVEPAKGLIKIYCEVYGFELVPAVGGQKEMCRREIK